MNKNEREKTERNWNSLLKRNPANGKTSHNTEPVSVFLNKRDNFSKKRGILFSES